MKFVNLRKASFFIAAFLFLVSARASAQAPLEPPQMPPRTAFYLIWRGALSSAATKSNALLSLWGDPGFAPTRAALMDKLLKGSGKENPPSTLTREELEQYSTLLENPFTLGYISEPEKHADAVAAEPSKASAHAWTGTFFVYDRTEKKLCSGKPSCACVPRKKKRPRFHNFPSATRRS